MDALISNGEKKQTENNKSTKYEIIEIEARTRAMYNNAVIALIECHIWKEKMHQHCKVIKMVYVDFKVMSSPSGTYFNIEERKICEINHFRSRSLADVLRLAKKMCAASVRVTNAMNLNGILLRRSHGRCVAGLFNLPVFFSSFFSVDLCCLRA